ncbi:unnamed protein product [Arabidopsis halleri]
MSNSTPISPFPVTETAASAPATVVEGVNDASRKRERPKTYDRDYKGRFTTKSGTFTPRSSLRNRRGDMSMGFGGGDFKPHMFTVNKGEDIIKRIMSFTENGSRGISVLSANGAVANVKIQLHSSSRRVVTYKDEYEIVSLSNTMAISESGGVKNKTGGWRIMIGGAPGASVFGGTLAGSLIAASPVQVVIGSFWPLVTKPPQTRKYVLASSTTPNLVASSSTGKVQQPDMIRPSRSQKRNDESNRAMVVFSPTTPNLLASSSNGQAQEPDMIGPSHSQERNDESKAMVVFSPTIPNLLASSSTEQDQQPDMIGPFHSQNRNDESNDTRKYVLASSTTPNLVASSSTGKVQQPDMIRPSRSQKRNDESNRAMLVFSPTTPNLLASSSNGQAQEPDMIGPSHSQERNDESNKAMVVFSPTTPNLSASSSTEQDQQPDMIGPFHSQNRNDESNDVILLPTVQYLLASSFTGQLQRQPEMMRNDEPQAVVVPPGIPNLLASSFTGPEMIEPSHSEKDDESYPSQFLTLGWYNSTPEQDK